MPVRTRVPAQSSRRCGPHRNNRTRPITRPGEKRACRCRARPCGPSVSGPPAVRAIRSPYTAAATSPAACAASPARPRPATIATPRPAPRAWAPVSPSMVRSPRSSAASAATAPTGAAASPPGRPGAPRARTVAAAAAGRTSVRLTRWAVPAITTAASTRSTGRSLSSAPAAIPAAPIPRSFTAPEVTSPSRSAPRWARNPRRGSSAPARSSYAPQPMRPPARRARRRTGYGPASGERPLRRGAEDGGRTRVQIDGPAHVVGALPVRARPGPQRPVHTPRDDGGDGTGLHGPAQRCSHARHTTQRPTGATRRAGPLPVGPGRGQQLLRVGPCRLGVLLAA